MGDDDQLVLLEEEKNRSYLAVIFSSKGLPHPGSMGENPNRGFTPWTRGRLNPLDVTSLIFWAAGEKTTGFIERTLEDRPHGLVYVFYFDLQEYTRVLRKDISIFSTKTLNLRK